jgi:hypothetical protein
MVCVAAISNAILWTHFVTPRGNQTQQDQTNRVSYYKKEEYEESEHNSSCSGLVRLYTSMLGLGGIHVKVENEIEYAFALFFEEGLAGLSCAESMMHLCNSQDMLIWNGPFEPDHWFYSLLEFWLT